MLREAIPRLVIRLRSTFPDAHVELLPITAVGLTKPSTPSHHLRFSFPNRARWQVECHGIAMTTHISEFQFFQSSLLMQFEQLDNIRDDDFLRLISAENFGLRGVTLSPGPASTNARGVRSRPVILQAGFVGQKGRTRDEAENIAIDVLSLLRFARLFEDRVQRSSVASKFSFEMYQSQFLSVSRGRNRYINYARSVFQGSIDRVFGQITTLLINDFRGEIQTTAPGTAKVILPPSLRSSGKTEFVLSVPGEVPMVTCHSPLMTHRGSNLNEGMTVLPPLEMMNIAARLNDRPEMRTEPGHFEVSSDGAFISYVSWKHLTNDIRLYSLDHMITALIRAEQMLRDEMTSHALTRPHATAQAPPLGRGAGRRQSDAA